MTIRIHILKVTFADGVLANIKATAGGIMKKIISTVSIFLFSITFVGEVFAGPKLTMLINQSPWFDGFRKTLEMYEEETE